ncbi:hypothetical protein AVEN_133739-1 [Araneus ventricosus]|uniref:Uncharacterized protein n=1 Tax=Araneus ventricosus TaxID=182803 RepID=A0A4Y2B6Y0_ARAVE|nr:hypothetical protein AVEN_133739-1 [Araneus ventricosus]
MVSGVPRELPQDQARGPVLSANTQKLAITLGRTASPDPKILARHLWFLSPEQQATISPSKTKLNIFLSHQRSIHEANDIPFTNFKSSRQLFLFHYRYSHQGKFCSLVSQKFTFVFD